MSTKNRSPAQKYLIRIPTESGEVKIRADKLTDAMVRVLDGLGDFVSTLGGIETEYPDLINGLRKVSDDPALLQQLTESLKPEVLQSFLVIVLRLMRISPDLNQLTTLSASKKVELGLEIKRISALLKKLGDQLKGS